MQQNNAAGLHGEVLDRRVGNGPETSASLRQLAKWLGASGKETELTLK